MHVFTQHRLRLAIAASAFVGGLFLNGEVPLNGYVTMISAAQAAPKRTLDTRRALINTPGCIPTTNRYGRRYCRDYQSIGD